MKRLQKWICIAVLVTIAPSRVPNPAFGAILQTAPARLADGTVGVFYSQQVDVVPAGDDTTVISGSLPPGLNLQITSGGFGVVRVIALNGTPTAPGTYTFTFQYGAY